MKNSDSVGKKYLCIAENINTYYQTKNENFEQSHSAKNLKEGGLWFFLTSILLQNIEKIETLKKFRKKVLQNRKRESHSPRKKMGRLEVSFFGMVLYFIKIKY